MATYPGGPVIDRAQQDLEQHAVCSADGLCVTCRVAGPCVVQVAAAWVFQFSARLPRRVPGATHPELIGGRRVAGDQWLAWAS